MNMPFFNLTDIKINTSELSKDFRQSKSLINNDKYDQNTYRYPIDLGMNDKGHYMVIHINQQVKSQFTRQTTDDLPTILENQRNTGNRSGGSYATQALGQVLYDFSQLPEVQTAQNFSEALVNKLGSVVTEYAGVSAETVNGVIQTISSFGSGAKEPIIEYLKQLSSGNFVRTIRRTTDTIALYMPDTLSFTNNQQYSSAEFGNSGLALLGAAAAGYSSIIQGPNSVESKAKLISKNLTPFVVSRALQGFGNAGLAVFAAASGTVVNPQLELIYSSPSFREFRFEFMLYPRSTKEAQQVQNILNRLRFHQAPEILGQGSAGGLGGFFLVPPSEFDIKFYYNGRINPNIPKISTCVLTSIDTDYAPNGWSAYEVPSDVGNPSLGKTGMPVGIRLSLTFQETEIMTKDNFKDPTFGEI